MIRKYFFLIITIITLFILSLSYGSVDIPLRDIFFILSGRIDVKQTWQFIILESRLPQTLTAFISGGTLAASGLLLQTAFRNPLGAPDIFGISGGAGLAVALLTLAPISFSYAWLTQLSSVAAAFIGAMIITAFIWMFSQIIRSNVVLLIIGIMVSYLTSSAITLLNFYATEQGVKNFVVWGMGSFGNVSLEQIPFYASVCIIATTATLLLSKPLNAMLLGEAYAENLGINVRTVRNLLLLITGIQTAVVTAYCGPISFIALAVPHIARLMLRTSNHRHLIPTSILLGCCIAMLCNVISCLPQDAGMLPLNAITPLIGAPVIIYVLLKQHSLYN